MGEVVNKVFVTALNVFYRTFDLPCRTGTFYRAYAYILGLIHVHLVKVIEYAGETSSYGILLHLDETILWH